MLTLSLLFGGAAAAPVDRAVQAQILPPGYDFVSEQLTGFRTAIGPLSVDTSWDCFHTVEVSDFTVAISLGEVSLRPVSGGIAVDVELERVRSEDFDIVGVTDWLDLCLDVDFDVVYAELADGRVTGTLRPSVVDGRVALAFDGSPHVEGALDSDIAWFPDTVMWWFVEDLVRETAAELLEDELPPLVEELVSDPVLRARLSGFDASFEVASPACPSTTSITV